jgi:hypothetical protein
LLDNLRLSLQCFFIRPKGRGISPIEIEELVAALGSCSQNQTVSTTQAPESQAPSVSNNIPMNIKPSSIIALLRSVSPRSSHIFRDVEGGLSYFHFEARQIFPG